MVTFSIPVDDVVEDTNGTPRSRSQLPFAQRAFSAASPFGSSTSRRVGTPYASSSRKLLATRDEVPSSSFNRSSTNTARNIFQASAMANSPSASGFSPSVPRSTMKKVFAPGAATPEPSRVYRESIAHATPRGMAVETGTKELFAMRIASPPPELTGEVLTQKVPKEWNAKGSIYADQFLAHLCPPDFDEEQRRQFFCVLDLRRLKYAANEIFNKKDWKLNVINFAKEFEKSRSIILLRYGLYEFQNVKPSKDVLKRWRREHGLPEPEDDDADVSTPSRKSTSKKRKAVDDDMVVSSSTPLKRRAPEQTADDTEPSSSTSTPTNRNKRKASMSEEQPAKMHRSTPSSAKSLFEKIANKPAAVSSPAGKSASVAKPTSFNVNVNKPATSSNLARSVFTATKPVETINSPPTTGASGGSNIFGHLSDSAKNSCVDADAESESGSERDDSQEAGHGDGPSVADSGAGDAGSQIGSGLFGRKSELSADGLDGGADTRDDTPGRSLFDRVTKGYDGQPARLDEGAEEPGVQVNADGDEDADGDGDAHVEVDAETEVVPASEVEPEAKKPVVDQTWNPTTTPIKFAPATTSAPAISLFGNPGFNNSSSSIFATKTSTPSNIFGATKQGASSARDSSTGAAVDQAEKDGGESDKENESQPTKKALFETKTPAGQSAFGSNSFATQSANSDARKPATSFFGGFATTSGPKVETKAGETSTALSPFVQQSANPSEAAAPSFLFGAKPAETNTTTVPLTTSSAPASLFGGDVTSKAAPEQNDATNNNSFGAKASSTGSSLFGGSALAPAQPSLFGVASSATSAESIAAKTDAPKLTFGFGNATTSSTTAPSATASKPLFGAAKTPSDTATATTGSNLFGSPMKQDDPSPAKKMFGGSSSSIGISAPALSFNKASSQPAAAPGTGVFGTSTMAAKPASGLPSTSAGLVSFGSGGAFSSSNAGVGSVGLKFNFGGGAATAPAATPASGFKNPFSSASGGTDSAATAAAPSSGSAFAFGAASSTPSDTSSPFQFGGSSNSASTLGGASGTGTGTGTGNALSFNFSAGGAATQGTGSVFGSNQAAPVFNLQPPAGGSATTGTNSPLNLGGGSSLATTPASGSPEPAARADGANDDGGANDEEEDGEKNEQVNLVDAVDEQEEILHQVRAKVLKFVSGSGTWEDGGGEKAKSKSPWSTQGIGQLRMLKHKSTSVVRLLLRAEPRGHVALNRAVLPNLSYKADEKYVKLTTSNEKGDGLETWMIQVKTKELAKHLADAMEKNKEFNKT